MRNNGGLRMDFSNDEIIYKRTICNEIVKYLISDDVIALHGARQVGKTHILLWLKRYLKEKNESTYFIDLEDSRFVRTLNGGPDELVKLLKENGFNLDSKSKKKIYVFIDEIQYLENPSSFIKLISDHHKGIILIVSGSSSFEIKSKFKDSLVGRTVDFEIFNLSFEEFLLFKHFPFDKTKVYTSQKNDELKKLFKEYILYGGYPKIAMTDEIEKKEKYIQQIIDTYVKKDIRDLAEIKDVEKFNKLLEVLASQSGNLLNITELSNTSHIARQTVEKYLFIMENTYVIKLLRPYSKNLRSELFKIPKIYFYDTGLMQMLWLKQLPKEIIGNSLETGIFSELVKNHGKDSVYFWRTKDKKEIDFILRIKNSIIPIEVKTNFQNFNPTAVNYFCEKYKINEYKIVGINGNKINNRYCYPWELS